MYKLMCLYIFPVHSADTLSCRCCLVAHRRVQHTFMKILSFVNTMGVCCDGAGVSSP